jgi:ribosomal protection tetracycline resistance protein
VLRRTLNLGIVAHVDAGKTTLTERLLYAAGVIDEIGSVDKGTTQTDSLPLEQRRGITIKSAVVSFAVDDVTVNLIDTPGHPDFIAEVERVLNVLDGAVLVISAVEGVQPQTRILMRALQRLRVPTLMFVNKIDRLGADADKTLQAIEERLTPAAIAMGSPNGLGDRSASFALYGAVDEGLTRESRQGLLYPVFFGSALTGAGVDALMPAITKLLPAEAGDARGPTSGTVFKIERGPAGEKIAYVRIFSGTVRTRDRLRFNGGTDQKVTAIRVFDRGDALQRDSVRATEIGKLWGLGDVRIGDAIGDGRAFADDHYFAPPSLETVVVPRHARDKGALHLALSQLSEQDPLINVRQDDVRQEIWVSLYGEVQKEVIEATLADEYGLEADFRETTTICIERPIGIGTAVERLKESPNPFLATVGLRIEPAAFGSGVEFRLEVELGSMPLAFFRAVEDTVRETLQQGIYGWEVTDCVVTMTHSGYLPRQSHAHQSFNKSMSSTGADFRGVTPLVVMSALRRAGTKVYEPIHRFHLEAPSDVLGPLLPALARLGAIPQTPTLRGSSALVEGDIPAARVHELRQQLPALTRGEGVLESAFDRYEPVLARIPSRPRSDHNPLNREEYLLRVARRVAAI